MNKSLITSVSPRECELIARGRQTMLVRKTRPKIETPFKCYVYCSKGKTFLYKNPNNGELFLDKNGGYRGGDYEDRYLTGKVIGSFVCDRVFELKINGDDCGNYWHEWDDEGDIQDMCLSYEELETYLGKSVGYGWHITEPKLFDKPRELGEFKHKIKVPWAWQENGKAIGYFYKRQPITRAPQSWMFCEE